MSAIDDLRDRIEDLRTLPNEAMLRLKMKDVAGALRVLQDLDAKMFALVTEGLRDDGPEEG